jgi:DNA-binding GntR family transcriptional regulator
MAKLLTTTPNSSPDIMDVMASVVDPGAGAASERIAADLRARILVGEIAPGERIRQEEVAERLGASRIPVREALRMLSAEGLVELETNKGARVPRLDEREVEVLYRMRERIEPLALIESMPHLSESDLQRIEGIQEQIEKGVDVTTFLTLDREFHLATYAGCATDQLLASVTRLWNSTQHYRRAFMMINGPGRQWIVNAEHRLLLDALTRNDAEDAERYLVGHIRRTRMELTKHPEMFTP